MELTQRKLPNKVNELYLLPVLFLLVNVTIIICFNVLNEYVQPELSFTTLYNLGQTALSDYLSQLRFQIISVAILLLITPLYLKYKKRWFLIVITILHAVELYYFFYVM